METVLIYVGIPALAVAIVFGLVFARGVQRGKRYRPGRPFEFRPVWFLSAPERMHGANDHKALTGAQRAALVSGDASTEWPATDTQHTETGGASDRW